LTNKVDDEHWLNLYEKFKLVSVSKIASLNANYLLSLSNMVLGFLTSINIVMWPLKSSRKCLAFTLIWK